MPTKIRNHDLYLWYQIKLLCITQFTQKFKLIEKGGQIIYTLIDGDGGEGTSKESKHSAEDYSSRSDDGSTEISNDSGYVKEPPLIFFVAATVSATWGCCWGGGEERLEGEGGGDLGGFTCTSWRVQLHCAIACNQRVCAAATGGGCTSEGGGGRCFGGGVSVRHCLGVEIRGLHMLPEMENAESSGVRSRTQLERRWR
jgi:hypothetical protein